MAVAAVRERLMRMRVRLRPHARFHRHEYRGEPWYVVQDEASGRAHRLSPAAHGIVAGFDGRRRLEEILADARARHGDEAPTEEELIALVATLYRADLVMADARPDLDELAMRGARMRSQRIQQYFLNPLALRFPLIDPDRFLERAAGWFARVPAWLIAAAWVAVVAAGMGIAASHWRTLTDGALDRIFSLDNLVVLWLVYPVVKLLHELAHGITIRRYGGQVHEMGVMVLVLVPVPYVDASAAIAFPSKRARMLVGGAGVLAELFLAGLAMIVWAIVEPGALRAVCFNVALIAGVSTLLFNGNPLLRFDGYYVLTDLVEIPNLGQRANAHLSYVLQRHLLRVKDATTPAASASEAALLVVFGVLSNIYRVFVSAGIVLLVATKLFFVGVLLALWAAATMILRPVVAGARFLAKAPQLEAQRPRAIAAAGGTLGVLAVVLFLLPVPQWTRTEGIVWAPERSQLRAESACWIAQVVAVPGATVSKGEPLVECRDPELASRVKVLEQQLAELQARDLAYFVESRLHLDVVREEIAHTEARLADARHRLGALRAVSPADGRFVMPQAVDAEGRFVQRGEVIAYVIEPGAATVRAVVDQADVDLVRASTRSVAIRPADRIPQTFEAKIVREVPGASERLPSLALGVPGGGPFGVDPRSLTDAKEEAAPKSVTPVFQFDLEVPAEGRLDALGMRVFVRFDHRPAPLAKQWYRAARRTLLRLFQV